MPTIGYIPGLDYGRGFDRMGAVIRGDAVIRTEPEAVPDTDLSKSSHIFIRMIESQTDMNTMLGISAEADIGVQHISGGGGKFDFSQECQYHDNSVWLIAYVSVMNSFKAMRDVQLKPEAADLLSNGHEDRFREEYGDFFVLGMQTGGQLTVVLEIETTGTSDLTQVKGDISASGLIGGVPASASVSVKHTLSQATFQRKTYLSIYQIGGNQGEPMTRETNVDIEALVEHIFSFPAQVAAGKSAAFAALIQDYKALPLPFEPNWVELLNARQALDSIMAQRQDALTSLNRINFILSHADQFMSFDSTKYTTYAQVLTKAVNTLTRAASECVYSPKDAKFPEDLTIPPIDSWPERKAGVPVQSATQIPVPPLLNLPQSKAIETLNGLHLGNLCTDTPALAQLLGLIVGQDPAAGTMVDPGSTIHLEVGSSAPLPLPGIFGKLHH